MTDNPYEPPSTPPELTVPPNRDKAARPLGVSILAVLHVVGGIVILAAQSLFLANLRLVYLSSGSVELYPVLLLIGVTLLLALVIASGIGMWMGRRWGWWCGASFYVYSVFRNAMALVTFLTSTDSVEDAGGGALPAVIEHGVRVIVHGLFFLHFFQGNVLAFFTMGALRKGKAIGVLVSVCFAIALVASVISALNT